MSVSVVVGAAGFIGRPVVRELNGSGHRVLGIDRSPPEGFPEADLAEVLSMELPSPDLKQILRKNQPDFLFNCAGRASIERSMQAPDEDFREGPNVTFSVLDMLRHYIPKCHYVHVSSAAVYGDPSANPIPESAQLAPISAYGYHKLMAELICKEFAEIFGLKTSVARVFSAYGPGLRKQVVWDICRKALLNPKFELHGTGRESRDFIHVSDVAFALRLIAENGEGNGDPYNVASGRETEIAELAARLLAALGKDRDISFSGSLGPGIPSRWCADVSKLTQLGFEEKVPFERGLNGAATWCKAELNP